LIIHNLSSKKENFARAKIHFAGISETPSSNRLRRNMGAEPQLPEAFLLFGTDDLAEKNAAIAASLI